MCGGGAMSHRLSVLIERICDGHVAPDRTGPLITLLDGRWAYCAGHGAAGHRWRAIAPTARDELEAMPSPVTLICADGRHVERGFEVADGEGFLIASDHEWAYCSAAVNEPHTWRRVAALGVSDIRHRDIPRLLAGSA